MDLTAPPAGKKPRVAALVGATAVGKTAVALALAQRCGAEIVNADSLQVYRELDIGTAKPTAGGAGAGAPPPHRRGGPPGVI